MSVIAIPETVMILDSTKIQSFMDCPRAFFYREVLGWNSEQANVHLEFGKAWHLAMEHIIWHPGDIQGAFDAFLPHYRLYFPEVMDLSNHPKNPAMALLALVEYVKRYENDVYTPLYTEIAGSVPLDDIRRLYFRMDTIMLTEDGYKSREHKTGSQLSRQWRDQWSLKFQTGTYNHVLYCQFPAEEVWGVEINGAIFYQKKVEFERVPSRRSLQMMNVWYWNALHWYSMVEWEVERLKCCKENAQVMEAFPMNTENCTKYWGCQYFDFCMAWANPLQRLDEIPAGFCIRYWNPLEEESKAKKIFHFDKKGGDISA